jgi:hypothetical protein
MLGGACSAFAPPVPQEQKNSEVESDVGAENSVLAANDTRYGAIDYFATSRRMTADQVAGTIERDANRMTVVPLAGGQRSVVGTLDTRSKPYVSFGDIYIRLTGKSDKPVILTRIRVNIVSRTEPDSGTLVYLHGEGGDNIEGVGFDLDSKDLNGRFITDPLDSPDRESKISSEHYLDRRQVTISKDESITFEMIPRTSRGCYKFFIEFGTSDGQVLSVGDGAEPWQLSAPSNHYQAAYELDVGGNITEYQLP